MIRFVSKFFRSRRTPDIDPDVIFLDSRNLPEFDTQQFEGRIEKPISRVAIYVLGVASITVMILFLWKVVVLQVLRGEELYAVSEDNTLRHIPIFAPRGMIVDRNGTPLAFNSTSTREYTQTPGFGHVLGYVSLPKDEDIARGVHPQEYIGRDGLERIYHDLLLGTHGLKIEEVDVKGEVESSAVLREPIPGESLTTTLDARLQAKLYEYIASVVEERGFVGGAGVLMDVRTGEIIALTSYPEYDPNVLTLGTDRESISSYLENERNPFLFRAVQGLYAPGSIIKPFVAAAALEENIISLEKKITSTGQLVLPNPYNPDKPSVFRDWKAHGPTNFREALAVSSDVYFYYIGGGFGSQQGLGIARIDEYVSRFGFAKLTGVDVINEAVGLIPTPEWKERTFDGEAWNIGNTYHTAIGQYGFQVTPIQAVRSIAAIANGGELLTPRLYRRGSAQTARGTDVRISPRSLAAVREGMRLAVTNGTAVGLNIPEVEVAAKTGTAELGASKLYVHSWVIGFFPYRDPRYAFAVVMEKGSSTNTVGGVYVMRQFLDWVKIYAPEYLSSAGV